MRDAALFALSSSTLRHVGTQFTTGEKINKHCSFTLLVSRGSSDGWLAW
jgi:hypothetical protein